MISIRTYHAIILLHRQPPVTDEEELVACLHVCDLHAAEVPGLTVATVIMPDSV